MVDTIHLISYYGRKGKKSKKFFEKLSAPAKSYLALEGARPFNFSSLFLDFVLGCMVDMFRHCF